MRRSETTQQETSECFCQLTRSLPGPPHPPCFHAKFVRKSDQKYSTSIMLGGLWSYWVENSWLCILLRNIECLRRRSSSILCWSPKQVPFEKKPASCQTNVGNQKPSIDMKHDETSWNITKYDETSWSCQSEDRSWVMDERVNSGSEMCCCWLWF